MDITEKAVQEVVGEWDEFHRNASKPQACWRCDRRARLWWNGTSCRSASVRVRDATQHVPEIRQRRLKCSACSASWTHRPPGLLANKHFQACVISSAVSQHVLGGDSLAKVAAAHDCSRRSVGRWPQWTAAIADPAVLAAKVVEAVDAVILPTVREIARRFEKLRDPVRLTTLRRAAQVLALMEALASALGLEPPGLRSVVERFLNGRTDVGTYLRPVIPELARGAQLM